MAIITLPFIFYFASLKLVYAFIFFFKYNKVPLIKGISIATWVNIQYKLELNSERAYLFICDRAGESEDESVKLVLSSVSRMRCSLGIQHSNFLGTINVSNFEVF